MEKGMTFYLDEELRSRLKIAAAYQRESIKAVLVRMVQEYVEEAETQMRPTIKKRARKEAGR